MGIRASANDLFAPMAAEEADGRVIRLARHSNHCLSMSRCACVG